jgi:hypothetical protein
MQSYDAGPLGNALPSLCHLMILGRRLAKIYGLNAKKLAGRCPSGKKPDLKSGVVGRGG